MDVHIYLHDVDSAGVTQKFDQILTQLGVIETQVKHLMPNLKDIQDKIAALQASVAAETNVDTSIVTLLQGLTAMIASLKQQLADAIAANDPAAVQAVLDGLTALDTTVKNDTQKLADAATANTPAA